EAFAKHGTPLDEATEAKFMAEMEAESLARSQTGAGVAGSIAGNIAGSGPLMAMGGAAKAATGLGGATSLLGRVGAGAAEASGMMVPQAVADAAEQAHREARALTGEQAVAAVGHGLIGAGLVGGGLGALGGLVGKLAGRRASRVIESTGET